MNKVISIVTGLTIFLLFTPSSLADVVLPGRCHMGECWEQKLIEKTLLKSSSQGKLYSVKIATRSWPMGSSPNSPFGSSQINYVYCSTKKPAYLFSSDGIYYGHLLNPGGDWYGYNMSDYPIYWATCHNFVGPDFFSERMKAKAIQLGYSVNLPSEQVELKNILDIMN